MSKDIDIESQMKYHKNCILLFEEMESRLIEREQLIRIVALTYFYKTNCFLIGDRGLGKSYAIEMFGKLVKGVSKLWQLLLKKETKSEEIFGRTYQTSTGEWKINTKDSLLDALVIFLDEMFKADGKILSGLLEVLVDRCYSFGDGQKVKTDIIAFFGASNEFPTERFMLPYVDRFLLWVTVEPIQDDTNRKRFYLGDFIQSPLDSDLFDITDIHYIYEESKKVVFHMDMIDMYLEITKAFIKAGIKTSDRKYKSIIGLIKTLAYLNGRDSVDISDLFILLFSAWHNDIEKTKVKEQLYSIVFGTQQEILSELQRIKELINEQESILKSNCINLLSYEYVFNGENQQVIFENLKNDIHTLLENNFVLENLIENIRNIDRRNKMIINKINNNIFILDIKENIFDDNIYKEIDKHSKILEDKRKKLTDWLTQNENLFAYKNNQSENRIGA